MKVHSKLAIAAASLALGAAPALALAAPPSHPGGRPSTVATGVPVTVTTGPPATTPPSNQGTAHNPTDPASHGAAGQTGTPAPTAGVPAKAKAYGKYCQGESKKHVAGQPGTPFSMCVSDMAKLATAQVKNPHTACAGESKKHVAGQAGTPFSLCVSGAAKLLKDQSTSDSSTS